MNSFDYKKLSNYECMVCYYDVEKNDNYYQCTNCSSVFHKKCVDDWEKKNGKKGHCIYCTLKGTLKEFNTSLINKIISFCC